MPFKAALGSATATASGTTLVITLTAAVAPGDLIVVRVASDNLTATTPTFTATDTAGHVYNTALHRAHNASPQAGAAVAILVTRATTAMATGAPGSAITVTLSGAVTHRAAYAESFTDVTAWPVRASTVNSNGPAQTSATTGALSGIQAGDLVLGVAGIENGQPVTADTDTLGGAWSTLTTAQSGIGTSNTFITVAGQHKFVTTADLQTYNVAWSGAANDYAAGIVALIPGVYVPPIPPTPPGHVTIGGLLFCVPPHGVAVRIEVQTPTQLLDVTDLVVRATWQQGGAYDAAGSPWFNPTPNPCELEIVTSDPKWDPTTFDAYDLVPLATNVKVLLAEQASFGTWATEMMFYGPLLAHVVEPQVGGGYRVTISAADALTNLGDMIADERGEEAPWQRLAWLASGVKDLDHGFVAGQGLDGPILGRYHPSAGQTRLELMNDSALAAGQALLFQPVDIDTPPPYKTIVYPKPQGKLSDPGVVFTAAVDPENGLVPTGGDVPYFTTSNRVACLTDIAVARQEQGFRTRIRSARTIAPWTISVNAPGPIAALPAGNHFWQSASFGARAGDRVELLAAAQTDLTWTTNPPPFLRCIANPYAVPGQGSIQTTDITLGVASIVGQPFARYAYEVPAGMAGQFVLGRYLIVTAGTAAIPATYTETVQRLAGTGIEVETVIAARETTYGQRAVTGFRSPIADQANLDAWNNRALAWITQPTVYPRLLRVATTASHPSPGAQQWAVHLVAGSRLSLRHVPTPAAPDAPTIQAWAVNIATTLTPTEVTLDVECGPTTSGST